MTHSWFCSRFALQLTLGSVGGLGDSSHSVLFRAALWAPADSAEVWVAQEVSQAGGLPGAMSRDELERVFSALCSLSITSTVSQGSQSLLLGLPQVWGTLSQSWHRGAPTRPSWAWKGLSQPHSPNQPHSHNKFAFLRTNHGGEAVG